MRKPLATLIALSALGAAHDNNTRLFMEGDAASASLQAMAEGGDISAMPRR